MNIRRFCGERRKEKKMVSMLSETSEFNVLASGANWAWPEALRRIFRPRDVNLLVADKANEFLEVIRRRRIHTAIIDMDSEAASLATVKIIRIDYPLLPCILLTGRSCKVLLSKALELNVFSVIDKPVDMEVLRERLYRLFLKRYDSNVFE